MTAKERALYILQELQTLAAQTRTDADEHNIAVAAAAVTRVLHRNHTVRTEEPVQAKPETQWAVVEVISAIHGTDETKGVTLARGLTHIEAALYKQAYFEGVQSCGCTVEDNFTIHDTECRLDKHYRGLLVCTEDRAP